MKSRKLFAIVLMGGYLYARDATTLAESRVYCDQDCGPTASCDQQCVDGDVITCGQYNGGWANGMCAGTVNRCGYAIVFFNGDRKIDGDLDVECPGIIGWIHSPPWSNFGVESPYSSREDSDQFAGWHWKDDKYQWNACTTESPYQPPNASYYNADDSTTQLSSTAHWYGYMPVDIEGTCVSQLDEQVITVGSTYMDVWDLDENWADQDIGTITFPGVNILMSCNAEDDTCTGESDWITLSSAPQGSVTAKLKVGIYASGYLGG
jgi:hypothetical protein